MYFSFLFLLRAVAKIQHGLVSTPYYLTGNSTEDFKTRELLQQLVGTKPTNIVHSSSDILMNVAPSGECVNAVEECKNGFDEKDLFQVCC